MRASAVCSRFDCFCAATCHWNFQPVRLLQEAVFSSDFQPSISYWFFATVTGSTGIMLVAVMSIIYVFAMPAVIRRAYHAFRLTHLLNFLLYALTIAHGLPKLLDVSFSCFFSDRLVDF